MFGAIYFACNKGNLMNNEIVVKNRLKQYRTEAHLSQEELAKAVGTTRQTIISIEKSQFNPSTKLALLLSLVLKVKVEDLFYLE